MWLEIPILCHTETSSELNKLGISSEGEYEIRTGVIDTRKIFAFYPSSDNEFTIVHIASDCIEVGLPYLTLKAILCK